MKRHLRAILVGIVVCLIAVGATPSATHAWWWSDYTSVSATGTTGSWLPPLTCYAAQLHVGGKVYQATSITFNNFTNNCDVTFSNVGPVRVAPLTPTSLNGRLYIWAFTSWGAGRTYRTISTDVTVRQPSYSGTWSLGTFRFN